MNTIVIEPDEIYRYLSITFMQTQTLPDINGPLSADLIAGLLLGLYVVYEDMVKNYNHTRSMYDTVLISDAGLYSDNDFLVMFDKIPDILKHYIQNAEIDKEDVDEIHLNGTFLSLFWFILNPQNRNYMLINFDNVEFIQGFISICNAFKVDFKRYVHGLPFKLTNGRKQYYEIQGY